MKRIRVETGAISTADFLLQLEGLRTTIDVDAPAEPEATPAIGGVITRAEIETLPLNGLNFLDLGKTEPGVQATAGASGAAPSCPRWAGPAATPAEARVPLSTVPASWRSATADRRWVTLPKSSRSFASPR